MNKPKTDNTVIIPTDIIEELLTDREKNLIEQRYMIMRYLTNGLSVRAIAKKINVGTDTVVRVSRILKSSNKLQQFFEKPIKKLESKWVFGQIGSEKE